MLIFMLICVFFVSLAEKTTKAKIEINEQELLIKRLNEIVSNYDNPILDDKFYKTIDLHGIEQILLFFLQKPTIQFLLI